MRLLSILSTAIITTTMTSFTMTATLSVSSPAFRNNGIIPEKYSCEGEEASPALHIGGVPPGAKSLALILHDPDAPVAGGFTHWVVWNIDTNGDIPEKFKGADQGLNGSNASGYKGMCPPSGTHHYHFKVYALDTKLDITKGTDKAGLEKAMNGHILAQGDLVGLYKKSK